MNIFIFPDAVNKRGENETISLDTDGAKLLLHHDGDTYTIDTELLADGSSTVVLSWAVDGRTFVLYNFREVLQALDMYPSEFLRTFRHRCFMQVDKSGGDVYVKVFLPKGERELASATDDFSGREHYTMDRIHPLDWRYSWTVRDVRAKREGECFTLRFVTAVSDFWKTPVYINHGGQSEPVHVGLNEVRMKYVPGEAVYLGAKNCRYKGRALNLHMSRGET